MSTKITLAGGCFWCIESAFKQVRGIEKAESGYAGGTAPNPSYEEVCTGRTGHAEVVQLTFDETQISVREILEIFFALHDPTQLNRQGNDIGTQYRSAVFYHNENQAEAAHAIIAEINQQNTWDGVVVTEVEPLDVFYSAGIITRTTLRVILKTPTVRRWCRQSWRSFVKLLPTSWCKPPAMPTEPLTGC